MSWYRGLYISDDGNSVCSKLILKQWGERSPSYDDHLYCGQKDDHAPNLDELKKHLRYCVEQWDKRWVNFVGTEEKLNQNKSVNRMAVVEATTCSLQPMANKYLKELGFKKCGPFKKLKHKNSKLYLWYITPEKFLEAIKE